MQLCIAILRSTTVNSREYVASHCCYSTQEMCICCRPVHWLSTTQRLGCISMQTYLTAMERSASPIMGNAISTCRCQSTTILHTVSPPPFQQNTGGMCHQSVGQDRAYLTTEHNVPVQNHTLFSQCATTSCSHLLWLSTCTRTTTSLVLYIGSILPNT